MLTAVEKFKDNISYQSALLAICCGVAAMLLVVIQQITQPVIALRIAEDQNALLSEVLNGEPFANKVFEHGRDVEFSGQAFQIFDVKNAEGEVINYVIRGSEEGYSGTIRYLIGVDTLGNIKGVRILSHTETPGLGDKIEIEKSDWVLSFGGRSLSNTPVWGVKKDGGDFDQFSGATITPRSVVRGVHKAMQALETDKESHNE